MANAENTDLPCLDAQTALSWRIYLGIFLIAATVSTMHNLFEPGIKTALQFDGRHYFESCQRVTALVLSLFTGKAAAIQAAEQALRPWILLDGPVLPVFFGLGFSLLGHVPLSSDWSLLLIGQTILQATCAVLVARLVNSLTGSRTASLLAALAWALYPPAIIAAQRLMTETIACCLLLALPLACDWARRSKAGGIASGLLAAALILLKPGMIPSVVLTITIVAVFSKKRAILAGMLVVGIVLGLSPWLAYTKFATGKAAVTVQRLPVHNALIGWDPETGGWQTSPPSTFERVLNSGSEPLPVVGGIWRSHPLDSLRILGEKPGHLYLVPWNDYRATVWGMDAKLQQLIHWLYLGLFLFGAAALVTVRRREPVDQAMLPLLCLATSVGQLVYIMFEPVCRYAFPLMAFAPVLGVAGVHALLRAKPGERKITALVATSFTAVILILLALSAWSASLRQPQTLCHLSPGDTLSINFHLNKALNSRCDTAMLLIDCDRSFAPTELRIDKHSLGSPALLPFALFDEQKSRSFNLLREFAYTFGQDIDDFRQWRAIPVPIEDLRGKTSINVYMRQGNVPATIYGLAPDSRRTMLSPDYLDVNRMINSPESLEPRVLDPVSTGGSNQMTVSDHLKTSIFMGTAVHLAVGMPTTTDPALTLAARTARTDDSSSAAGTPKTVDSSSAAGTPKTDDTLSAPAKPKTIDSRLEQARWSAEPNNAWSLSVDPQMFGPLLRDANTGTIVISRAILKAAPSNVAIITMPKSLSEDFTEPTAARSLDLQTGGLRKRPTYLVVKLTGALKSDHAIGSLGLVVSSVTASGAQNILCRVPKAIVATHDWQSFAFTDLLALNNANDSIKGLSLSLFPAPWQQVAGYGCDKSCSTISLKSLKLKLEPTDLPSFDGKQVFYY